MDARQKTQEQLQKRTQAIHKSADLIQRTRNMYDKYGQDLKASYDQFGALENSLSSMQLRIAVLGEYSRGKSSLLNALLGIEQLPTAQEATTAINAFIYGLPENETTAFLNIIYHDGRKERVDIQDGDQDTLEKWGTELDEANKDARKEVEYIELYIDHPLLNQNLALIDTPGMQTIHEHHEIITRKAIEQAHMAIWVQSVQQLGGNSTEWNFLRGTLRKSFNKFITVVNCWDLVLDPQDSRDQRKPQKDREAEKLDIVRKNFHESLPELGAQELKTLTSPDNLFGVSAKWARSSSEEQRKQSGLDKLLARIQKIADTPEDREEIIYKPLKRLMDLQDNLKEMLSERLEDVSRTDSLDKQRQDQKTLELEIKGIEQDQKIVEQQSREDHDRHATAASRDIRIELISPLQELKGLVENTVTKSYVRDHIENRRGKLDLPPATKESYDQTMKQINARWEKLRQSISERLEQLRLDFTTGMNKYVSKINQDFAKLEFNLPELTVNWQVDFGQLERFYMEQQQLEQNAERLRRELEELEDSLAEVQSNELLLENARESVAMAEKRIAQHGSRPAPKVWTESEKVSEGGMYSDPEYKTVECSDDSAGRAWEEKRDEYDRIMANREAELQRIIEDEERKRGIRMSREKAMQRLERKIRDFENQAKQQQARGETRLNEMVEEAHAGLLRNTAGQIDKFANMLQNNADKGIEELFNQHLDSLKKCVAEQFTDKLNAKQSSLTEAIAIIEQGEQEVAKRKQELNAALADLDALKNETQTILGAR